MAPACLLTVRTGHVADMDTHPLPHMFLLRARKMVYVLDCGNHLPDIYGRRDMWIVRQRDYRASLALDVFLRRYPELASGGTRDPLMGWKQLFASAVVYMAWLARVSVLPPPDGAVKRCLV